MMCDLVGEVINYNGLDKVGLGGANAPLPGVDCDNNGG
jgi:hypothetical protein